MVVGGGNGCPPSTGDGSTGLIASSLAPALSSPSLSSAPLLSTFFLFEKNCEKTAAVLATYSDNFVRDSGLIVRAVIFQQMQRCAAGKEKVSG